MNRRNYILLLLVVFVGFLIFGFSENIKGPAIPRMLADFRLSELQIGLLLALNSLGYLLACGFTGAFAGRFGLKLAVQLAFGSMVVSGFLIYVSSTFTAFSASYFVMYIGNGMLEIALAILSARIFVKNTGMMMNLSHFFYGLSSMVAPLIATYLMGVTLFGVQLDWRGMYVLMLSLAVIPMIPALFPKFPSEQRKTGERLTMKAFSRDPIAWLIVAILSFGVVSELAIGGWLVNFLEKAYGWEAKASSGMLSAFFFFFMLARLVLGPVTDRIGYVKSLIIFSAASGLCTLGGIVVGESGAILFALAGIGIALIYPTVMALLARRYPNGSDTAITFTVTLMGVASVIGNFLVGAFTDGFKWLFTRIYDAETGLTMGLQVGYAFIGLCAVLSSVASVMLYRRLKQVGEVL